MSRFACHSVSRRPWFEGVALELDAGEIVFLRGATGTGKSLFLRGLADLDPLDGCDGRAGHPPTIELDGRERASFRAEEWRTRVVYVHQSSPQLGGTALAELERIGALAATSTRREGAISKTAALAAVGLAPDMEAGTMSGGERQLLALARALFVAPDVLLLDESTSALDEARARIAEDVLVGEARRGASLLWISHDDRIAERLGARTVSFP